MLGAIIGDIVGSIYEWNNIKTKEFPLFRDNCFFTDDTVMTCAVADAIMQGGSRDDFIDSMKKYGRMYPDAGYGGRFSGWLYYDSREPYNSFGNGSAMRVSPCAWVTDCGNYAKTGVWPANGRELARLSAEVTHNHPEGIKGALATADAIFLCRCCFGGYPVDGRKPVNDDPAECKRRIRKYIEEEYGYDLSATLDEIRPDYRFNETCQNTVPQAIIAFLESTDFEDAIRNAISLGGDSDTLAAITGSIAEAAYGIPDWIKEKALSYLDEPLRDVLTRWDAYISTEIQKLITVDCIVQEDPDNWKEKTVSILEDGQEIGEYTIYYYTDDSDAVYFAPIINGEEKKTRELSGPYQPYAYDAKSIRESIIRDLKKMGYRIEDAERKLVAIW